MKLLRLSFVIVLVAALSGCQLIPGFNPPPSPTPALAAPTLASLPATATAATPARLATTPAAPKTAAASPTATFPPGPAGPLILVSKDLIVNKDKPPYEIKVHYPAIAGATTPGLQAFNTEAKKMAQDLAAGFQKDFDQAQPLPEPSAAPGSFMETRYTVTHGEHGLLSILYTVGYYFSGAAHPNSNYAVLNFDLIHGKKLELTDLFLPGSDYLNAVADACRADLTKRDRLAFPEGALPKPENYSHWNITPQGLQFSFEAYQVAPYAMGPSQVTLSYASLQRLLKPDGLLAVLLK